MRDVGRGLAAAQSRFDIPQQRRAGDRIHGRTCFSEHFICHGRCSRKGIDSFRRGEYGHLHRERDQQKDTADQCRIKRVATQAAECHFPYPDGHQRTQHNHPHRQRRRQVETEQDARHNSRAIPHRRPSVQQVTLDQVFEQYAREDCNTRYQQRRTAVNDHRNDQRGKKRDEHVDHQPRRRNGGMYMG